MILTQFIQENQRIGCGVLQNRGGLAELHQERALTGQNVVVRAQSRENTVHQRYAARAGWHVAALCGCAIKYAISQALINDRCSRVLIS